MKYPPKKGGKWGGKQISKGFQQQHLGDDAGARASPAAAPAPTARPRPLVPQRGRGFLGLSLLPFFGEKKAPFGGGLEPPGSQRSEHPGRSAEHRGADLPPSLYAGPEGYRGVPSSLPGPGRGLRRHREGGEGGVQCPPNGSFHFKVGPGPL